MGNFRGWEWIIIMLIPIIIIVVIVVIVQSSSRGTQRQQPNAPVAAGWLPDPNDPTLLRCWDGTQWTEQTTQRNPHGP